MSTDHKPFNGHTPVDEWNDAYDTVNLVKFNKDDAEFAHHAVSTYYTREAEIQAIDDILHFTAHKLTASEAVKWMNELYGEQCADLQAITKEFKMGMGGEKLTTAVREGLKAREAELSSLRAEIPDGYMVHSGGNPVEALRFIVKSMGEIVALNRTLEDQISGLEASLKMCVEALDVAMKSLATYGPHPLIELQANNVNAHVKATHPNL